MLNRIPLVGIKIKFSDLYSGFGSVFGAGRKEAFIEELSKYFLLRHIYLTSSGIAAFYIILQALKEISSKREVILPAYTAPALVLPILKSGLKPILCDISLDDFNLDTKLLLELISKDTLCVVPVHMFGIVVKDIENLRKNIPEDVFIVEDCAQAMGSKMGDEVVGVFGDISFFSFNRGKNLSTYGGGCIGTGSKNLGEVIKDKMQMIKEGSRLFKFILPFKFMAFSLAIQPCLYGIIYPVASRFKDNRVPGDFKVRKLVDFQAGVGLSLFKRLNELSERRYYNGMTLIEALKNIEEIILPKISPDTKPAFNRLPILFRDLDLREKIEKALMIEGIETSHMYLSPLHHIFKLGYKREDFPNAHYFNKGLLTVPTHSLVNEETLKSIIRVFKETLKGVNGSFTKHKKVFL